MVSLTGLDHLVLTVADIDVSVRFYREILGMKAEVFQPGDGTTRTALKFGAQKINFHLSGAEFEPKAVAAMPGSADLCFLTDHPLDSWQVHLGKSGVEISLGPVARTGARGQLSSIYIRDPDGNLIEIATYD